MHTYTVQLHHLAEFPLDMLRYDDAAPATADDAALISLMQDLGTDRSHLPKKVSITLRALDRCAPHTKRWESFGVLVVETDNRLSEISQAARPQPGPGTRLEYLSIAKCDADAYDIHYKAHTYDAIRSGRLARLRADYSEDAKGVRTAKPGTWRIFWEGDRLGLPLPVDGLTNRHFETVQEAFSDFVQKMLG